MLTYGTQMNDLNGDTFMVSYSIVRVVQCSCNFQQCIKNNYLGIHFMFDM